MGVTEGTTRDGFVEGRSVTATVAEDPENALLPGYVTVKVFAPTARLVAARESEAVEELPRSR